MNINNTVTTQKGRTYILVDHPVKFSHYGVIMEIVIRIMNHCCKISMIARSDVAIVVMKSPVWLLNSNVSIDAI